MKLRAARRKSELRAAGQEHQRDGRREATPERAPRRAGDGARPARCLEEPRGVGGRARDPQVPERAPQRRERLGRLRGARNLERLEDVILPVEMRT